MLQYLMKVISSTQTLYLLFLTLTTKKMVPDKHTFQVGDDLYEDDLPKPYIQYTPHQIKHLQMKESLLALIINKLQKVPTLNKYYQTLTF